MKVRINTLTTHFTKYSYFPRFSHFIKNLGEPKVQIFMYHRISERQKNNLFSDDIMGPTAEVFEKQIATLCRTCHIVSLMSYVESVQTGGPLPKRCAVITFDDGYKDNYTLAYPILRKYNVAATIFLATGHIGNDKLIWTDKLAYVMKKTSVLELDIPELGRYDLSSCRKKLTAHSEIKRKLKAMADEAKDSLVEQLASMSGIKIQPGLGADLFLDWENVRTMHANGVDFGAHTVTHPRLTRVSKERARAEIADSKKRIEAELNEPVRTFCYPGGAFDEDIKSMVREEGFDCAVTVRRGTNNLESDLYALRRIGIE